MSGFFIIIPAGDTPNIMLYSPIFLHWTILPAVLSFFSLCAVDCSFRKFCNSPRKQTLAVFCHCHFLLLCAKYIFTFLKLSNVARNTRRPAFLYNTRLLAGLQSTCAHSIVIFLIVVNVIVTAFVVDCSTDFSNAMIVTAYRGWDLYFKKKIDFSLLSFSLSYRKS